MSKALREYLVFLFVRGTRTVAWGLVVAVIAFIAFCLTVLAGMPSTSMIPKLLLTTSLFAALWTPAFVAVLFPLLGGTHWWRARRFLTGNPKLHALLPEGTEYRLRHHASVTVAGRVRDIHERLVSELLTRGSISSIDGQLSYAAPMATLRCNCRLRELGDQTVIEVWTSAASQLVADPSGNLVRSFLDVLDVARSLERKQLAGR